MSQPSLQEWLGSRASTPLQKSKRRLALMDERTRVRRAKDAVAWSQCLSGKGQEPRKPAKARTRIKQVSSDHAIGLRKYEKAKAEHFIAHPYCQWPGDIKCPCSTFTHNMDCHHSAGRNGPLLYCKKYLRTACRHHHNLAKSDPKQSRAIGWIVDVSSEEIRRLKREELLNPNPTKNEPKRI